MLITLENYALKNRLYTVGNICQSVQITQKTLLFEQNALDVGIKRGYILDQFGSRLTELQNYYSEASEPKKTIYKTS